MIRILHVFGWTDRGGAETMVMNYYRKIDRSKIQFDFVKHIERRCDYDDEIESLGGRIFSLPRFRGINLIGYIRAWVKVLKEHPEWHTIHIHHYHLAVQIAIAVKIAGVRNIIIHVHTVGWNAPFYTPVGIHSRLNVACFPLISKHLFACGQKSGEFFYGKHKFTILPNAINLELFAPNETMRKKIREKCGFRPKDLVISHVGRFIVYKNHIFLLKIFIEVLKQKPNARLLLVGAGELRESVEKYAVELGIRDKVVFAGLRNDVYNWLQAADIFLLPSISEGLPVCVVEAQASGLSCVMSDHIDSSVDVTDNVYYESVNSSPVIWAERICNMTLPDKSELHNKVVKSHYNIDKVKKWLEDFYLSIQ